MEIEGQDGARIELSNSHHDKAVFGRTSGFGAEDRSVSRRHVAFQAKPRANQIPPRVSFEVLGKNPVWVRRNEDDEVRVFRRTEKGELSEGDWFCVSAKGPTWFALRRIGDEDGEARVSDEDDEIESDLVPSSRIGSEFEGFDVSDIDPVKGLFFTLNFFFLFIWVYNLDCYQNLFFFFSNFCVLKEGLYLAYGFLCVSCSYVKKD